MIAYILKSSLSLLIMFGLYWFLLRREKLFRFNRFFLMFSIIFSLVIPVVSIPVKMQENDSRSDIITAVNTTLATFSSEQESASLISDKQITVPFPYIEEKHPQISFYLIFLLIYLSGILVFLIRFFRNIFFIIRQIDFSEKLTYSGYTLALTGQQVNPYSFFGTIVVCKSDYQDNRIAAELLQHELEHIRQLHSIDVIIVEIIRIIYWFNPLILLYNQAIRINHEYLADNGVINKSSDVISYVDNLINFICHKRNIRLTSGSNPKLTRSRLLMLTKSRSGKTSEGARIFITANAVMALFLMLCCVQSNSQPVKKVVGPFGKTGLQSNTVKDIDDNVYPTITLGKQVWMAENLKTTRYNDGEKISLVTDSVEWQEYKPAYCWYNNDEKTYKNKFGALYNWYTVNTNKLCPVGWHVPNENEFWFTLQNYLIDNGYGFGGSGNEIGKSIASTYGWIPDSTAGNVGNDQSSNNKSGFTAVPAGYRGYSGEFIPEGKYSSWWYSSEYNTYIGKRSWIAYYYSVINPGSSSKRDGLSVRCLKNALDSGVVADFSGTWELNLNKTNNFFSESITSQTLEIAQEGDVITLQRRYIVPEHEPFGNRSSYIIDGEETTIKSGEKTERISAKWSLDKQSFTITNILIATHNGTLRESKRTETHVMVDNGKTLVVSYDDTLPEDSPVPWVERAFTMYYDKR